MILLSYGMHVHSDREDFDRNYTINSSNLHAVLLNRYFNFNLLDDLELTFRNGDRKCLFCQISEETASMDTEIFISNRKEYSEFIETWITGPIEAELMKYERQEFEFREMEL